jgi:hypothetical protein
MEKSTPMKTGVKWGLIMGVVLAVYYVGVYASGQVTNQALGYLSWLIIVGAVVMGLREFKASNEGFMSFGQGVGLGAIASLLGGVIESVARYVYIAFNPDIIEQLIAFTRAELEKNPDLPAEQLDMAMEMSTKFMTPAMMTIMGVIGTLVLGVITALIASAVMKAERPEYYEEMDEMGQ